jgi:hypothetical protein
MVRGDAKRRAREVLADPAHAEKTTKDMAELAGVSRTVVSAVRREQLLDVARDPRPVGGPDQRGVKRALDLTRQLLRAIQKIDPADLPDRDRRARQLSVLSWDLEHLCSPVPAAVPAATG